jgi:hypothetical protein
LLEARGTEDCIANDQQRPAVTELLDGLSDAAVDVVEACSGHPRRPRRILITGCFKQLSIPGYGFGSGASRGSWIPGEERRLDGHGSASPGRVIALVRVEHRN